MNNQKIAKWAGFKKFGWQNWDLWLKPDEKPLEKLTLSGLYPNSYALPNFPNDLNACEKWIWPKILRRQGYYFELRSPYKDIPYCFIIGKHDEHEACTLYSGESDNPATAVCLACEKLIGEGE